MTFRMCVPKSMWFDSTIFKIIIDVFIVYIKKLQERLRHF